MIPIPVKVLMRYLRASSAEQQALLRAQRYPTPESVTPLRYHSRARSVIAAYHRGDLSLDDFEAAIALMRAEAKRSSRYIRAELTSNAEVLTNWIAHHAHRYLLLQEDRTFELRRLEVEVRAKPNIIATEHEERRLIFFAFGAKTNPSEMRLLAELAFEVVTPWLRGLRPEHIQVVDRLGTAVRVEHRSPSLASEITIACTAISQAWPTIQPPPGWVEGRTGRDSQLSIDWHPE